MYILHNSELFIEECNYIEATSRWSTEVRKCIHVHVYIIYIQDWSQASVELGAEDVSLQERCPHFRGCYVHVHTVFNGVGT